MSVGPERNEMIKIYVVLLLATILAIGAANSKFVEPVKDSLEFIIPSIGECLATEKYIEQFDPKKYEYAGTDYFNERYSPNRLKKPFEQIDITYDYDFSYLNKTIDSLHHVNRLVALKAIFQKVTAGSQTDKERHLAILKFLNKAAHHNQWVQPMYENKEAVYDPLVHLAVGEMRCGAVSRLSADLFEAAGYKTRIVQAVSHQSAEIFYDGSWHLFEADLAGGGQAIMINGRIPSLEELAEKPYLIDKIPTHFEYFLAPRRPKDISSKESRTYPSYFFFSKEAFGTDKDAYYYKLATRRQNEKDKWYGWFNYKIDTRRWKLSNIERKYEPNPPVFVNVVLSHKKATVTWAAAKDTDNDLLGYRIYVSKNSRGWQYQNFTGSDPVKPFFHGGWKPEMYDAMFREPPHETDLIMTSGTSVEIDLPIGETRYITVMPFDKHGESVGRTLYNMSEELNFTQTLD